MSETAVVVAQADERTAGKLVPIQSAEKVVVDQKVVESKRLEIVNNWQGNLPTKMAYQMARLSVAYGLDPFLKELVVLGDNVYPTVAALHRKANEDPNYDGEDLRPATEEERKAFYAPMPPPENEHLWRCGVYLKNRSHPIIGWGRASKENVKMSTMQIWLPEMAQKRARGRAYRIAFNIGMPTVEDMYEFEDGSTMRGDKEKEVVLMATPDDIDVIEKKIMVLDYVTKGHVTEKEWNQLKLAMGGQLTKERAEVIKLHFLGNKERPGVIEVRKNATK